MPWLTLGPCACHSAAYQIVKPMEETSSTEWDLVMSTNVTAPFCLIREFLPELKAARGPIVNVSSIHANLTKPGFVAYATSKVSHAVSGSQPSLTALLTLDFRLMILLTLVGCSGTFQGALCALTRALAVELGDSGVRCNAILPAATATPMLLAGFEGAPEKFKELSSMHPVGRICDPKEIGEFIAFLGSVRRFQLTSASVYKRIYGCSESASICAHACRSQDSSRFITGSELQIDGGIGGRLHDPV